MKGYVSHLITENEKLEQELMADYDAAHAPVSHQQLLALQLRGDIDELSVCIHDCVSLAPMVKDLPADLLEEAGHILARQQAMDIRTVSFLDEMSYPCRLNELDIFRSILLHGMGDWSCWTCSRRYLLPVPHKPLRRMFPLRVSGGRSTVVDMMDRNLVS